MARGLKSGATVPVVISDYSPRPTLSDRSDSWIQPHKGNALRRRCFTMLAPAWGGKFPKASALFQSKIKLHESSVASHKGTEAQRHKEKCRDACDRLEIIHPPVHLEMFFYPPPPCLSQGVFILSPNFLLCERFYMGITLWLVPMSRPFRALRMVCSLTQGVALGWYVAPFQG